METTGTSKDLILFMASVPWQAADEQGKNEERYDGKSLLHALSGHGGRPSSHIQGM